MKLVSELRRRNVFRMAVLYIVAAWLIMQVAEVLAALLPELLPEWLGQVTVAVLVIGFPIALILSSAIVWGVLKLTGQTLEETLS